MKIIVNNQRSYYKTTLKTWTNRGGWAHKTSLTLPLVIDIPVPSQECKRSCLCVFGVLICLSLIFLNYWILELFRQCGKLCFSFYRTFQVRNRHSRFFTIVIPARLPRDGSTHLYGYWCISFTLGTSCQSRLLRHN